MGLFAGGWPLVRSGQVKMILISVINVKMIMFTVHIIYLGDTKFECDYFTGYQSSSWEWESQAYFQRRSSAD